MRGRPCGVDATAHLILTPLPAASALDRSRQTEKELLMSATDTPALEISALNERTNDEEIPTNSSLRPADRCALIGRSITDELDPLAVGDPALIAELIAYVLGRAHRMAEALNAPDGARAILCAALSFADELAGNDPRFDRSRFMRAATGL
jgi:hypothetical protein